MKSLEARKADREQRKAEAKKAAKAAGEITATGTLAEGKDTGDGEEEEDESAYADSTVAELKEDLDGRGIEYAASAKKADLIKLLEDDDNA